MVGDNNKNLRLKLGPIKHPSTKGRGIRTKRQHDEKQQEI